MSLKDVQPGTYRARAMEGVWCKVGKNNTPAVGVRFKLAESKESIWHVLYMTQTMLQSGHTVMEKSMDTLVGILGYNEDKALAKDAQGNLGFDSSYLSDKEVNLVLENETFEGKTHLRVKWINELGGNRLVGIPVEQVLGNVNLKAAAAAARARMGAKAPMPMGKETPAEVTQRIGDVPF